MKKKKKYTSGKRKETGAKKMYSNAGNNTNIINEPQSFKNGEEIIFFASMQEENEYTWRQYALMTPEECLALVTRMRLTAYPYLNTNLKPWGNTLYFD